MRNACRKDKFNLVAGQGCSSVEKMVFWLVYSWGLGPRQIGSVPDPHTSYSLDLCLSRLLEMTDTWLILAPAE